MTKFAMRPQILPDMRIFKAIKQSEHNRNPKLLGAQRKVPITRLLNVEDIGSIYTYRDQANRAAAKRFMEAKRAMTPSSQRRRTQSP